MSIVHQLDKRSGITYVYESTSYWDKDNLNFQPEVALKASQARNSHVIGSLDLLYGHPHIMFLHIFKCCL